MLHASLNGDPLGPQLLPAQRQQPGGAVPGTRPVRRQTPDTPGLGVVIHSPWWVQEGLVALWRGWVPSVIGVVPYVGLNFAVSALHLLPGCLDVHGVGEGQEGFRRVLTLSPPSASAGTSMFQLACPAHLCPAGRPPSCVSPAHPAFSLPWQPVMQVCLCTHGRTRSCMHGIAAVEGDLQSRAATCHL